MFFSTMVSYSNLLGSSSTVITLQLSKSYDTILEKCRGKMCLMIDQMVLMFWQARFDLLMFRECRFRRIISPALFETGET